MKRPSCPEASRAVFDAIVRSGTALSSSNSINLNGGAFPSGPTLRWLRDPGHISSKLELTKVIPSVAPDELYVLVGGFDDSDHPEKKYRKTSYDLQLPGGKREPGESGLDCVIRETYEETRVALNPDNYITSLPGTTSEHRHDLAVRFAHDAFGPYHIVATLPNSSGTYPAFAEPPNLSNLPPPPANRELECRDCTRNFLFEVGEQEHFAKKGFDTPRRCKPCRALNKAKSNGKGKGKGKGGGKGKGKGKDGGGGGGGGGTCYAFHLKGGCTRGSTYTFSH